LQVEGQPHRAAGGQGSETKPHGASNV
jgi:hypothetical protein